MGLTDWAVKTKKEYARVVAFITFAVVAYDTASDWYNFYTWNKLNAFQSKQMMDSGTLGFLLVAAICGTIGFLGNLFVSGTICLGKEENFNKDIKKFEDFCRIFTLMGEDYFSVATICALIRNFQNRMCKVAKFQELTAISSKLALVGSLFSIIWSAVMYFSSGDDQAAKYEKVPKNVPKCNTAKILINILGFFVHAVVFLMTCYALGGLQFFPFEQSTRVFTGPLSPGLDAKPDEGMFIYQKYHSNVAIDSLPVPFKLSSFKTVYNRIYIGQFDELFDNYPDPIIRHMPCSSAMPSVSKMHNGELQPQELDYASCVLIFSMRINTEIPELFRTNSLSSYFSSSFESEENIEINVRYGMRMLGNDGNTCTVGPWNKYVSSKDFFAPQVVQDLVTYLCQTGNQTCTEDDRMPPGGTNPITVDGQTITLGGMCLVIHNMTKPDSCDFPVTFDFADDICDSRYGDLRVIDSIPETKTQYPQFITRNED